jgi:hypothetical protein
MSSGFCPEEGQLREGEKCMQNTPFSEAEVTKAVAGMKTEAAPGPNSFTMAFFKKLWPLIKKEVMGMVLDFNKAELDISRLNYGVITLVPKTKEANTIRRYRPICLLNVDFKNFPKLLTDMISPLANRLICENQTTFVQGMTILEGVVILHEVIHELKRSKKEGVLFKINFEKAYDNVRQDFVEEVMRGKDFPDLWINQVMSTIRGGKVCVDVNGGANSIF